MPPFFSNAPFGTVSLITFNIVASKVAFEFIYCILEVSHLPPPTLDEYRLELRQAWVSAILPIEPRVLLS